MINRTRFVYLLNNTSAHAALAPDQGINALDAAVLAYSNVNALRQQVGYSLHINVTNKASR